MRKDRSERRRVMIHVDFEKYSALMAEDKPVLLEYWAPWCVYCRRIASALEAVATQQADNLVVGQVNIDDVPELAQKENIDVIPTLILYRKGEKLGSIVAPDSKAKIDAFILETLKG